MLLHFIEISSMDTFIKIKVGNTKKKSSVSELRPKLRGLYFDFLFD